MNHQNDTTLSFLSARSRPIDSHGSVTSFCSTATSRNDLNDPASCDMTSVFAPRVQTPNVYLKFLEYACSAIKFKTSMSSANIGKRLLRSLFSIMRFEAKEISETHLYDHEREMNPSIPLIWTSLLYITELPFLILWIYSTYWVVIVVMTTQHGSKAIWLSAVAAGFLVGFGLNANAYKSLALCHQRYLLATQNQFNQTLKHEEADTFLMDWGTVIRFFIIPFGVSSLSGLTHAAQNDFLLVFPRDPVNLIIALFCPTVTVSFLFLLRIIVLRHLQTRRSLYVLFFNGTLVR